MVAKFYGKNHSLNYLRERSHITRLGVSMLGISEAAESIGFRTTGVKINFEGLKEKAPLPCIVHWNQNHFVVIYQIKNKIYVADPAFGRVQYSKEEFLKGFVSDSKMGLSLFLTPTPKFYELEDKKAKRQSGLLFLFSYLKLYTKFFIQLFLGLIAGSIILLITPFLTQALVDFGINKQNIRFVYAIFIAQLMLFAGSSSIEIIRSWILLHIGIRVNISIVSDFLMKLLNLPLKFFDSKMMGDILQRIEDHRRIEKLLTTATLNALFSFVNIIIFGIVLLIYDGFIFAIFFAGSIISTFWTLAFLKRRKTLDFTRFNQQSLNRGKLIHLLEGIEEIKVSNSEKQKRWEWENIQAKLFKINIKSLSLGQFQQFGSSAITQFKNIAVSIIAAKAVIDGNITLGAMMAIMFIIGQLNIPITQILNFVLTLQDAKIGLERINEIHNIKDEEAVDKRRLRDIPDNKDIILKNMSFSYDGTKSNWVLKNLNLVIPAGKITAIIGISGSGKTTLMKLLLKFYKPQKGKISLGNI
ncbi:MAG: peptidase domain-containing ABC transporter, partial [Methanosarcinales archaeon]